MTTTALCQTSERALLEAAFHSFDQAAQTLQQSYSTLTARVEHMDGELAQSNEALRQQLRENEAMRMHMNGILESLSTGILVLNDAGLIQQANVPATQLLGLSASELTGRHESEILRCLGLLVGERPQRRGQTVVTISRAPIKTGSGGQSGSLLLIQDVTRVYQLEEQLQRKDRLAAMGEMIGRIAHEIRNPLGSVELFASMLRRDLADLPASQQYAEQISQAVHAMDRLLANLLMYTKPERIPRGWHAIESMVLDSLTLAAHAITKVPVDIRLDLDPCISSIWCHDGQMKQVVLNLIVNAVQAMPEGGVLTISLRHDGTHALGETAIRLIVTDSGIGIDEAHRSRIFDPFFTTKDEGTGLGLAIVHAIIEAHHGRIDVESAAGHGTSFSILLPHPAPVGLLGESCEPRRKLQDGELSGYEPDLVLVEETAHD